MSESNHNLLMNKLTTYAVMIETWPAIILFM